MAEKPYAVWVDADIHDPTDPDLISENVLEGEYDGIGEARVAAARVSASERTLALVYDRTRKSEITGGDLLLALYENGREAR